MQLYRSEHDGNAQPAIDAIDRIRTETNAVIQAFDARYIVNREHLTQAAELASRAFERDDAIADDRAIEILLYAAGRRQINRAFQIGISDEAHPLVLLVDGGDETGAVEALREVFGQVEPFETPVYDEAMVRSYYDISVAELSTGASLVDLVLERVALLVVNR